MPIDRPALVQPSSGSAFGGLLSPALQCEPWNEGGEAVVAEQELIQGLPGARHHITCSVCRLTLFSPHPAGLLHILSQMKKLRLRDFKSCAHIPQKARGSSRTRTQP